MKLTKLIITIIIISLIYGCKSSNDQPYLTSEKEIRVGSDGLVVESLASANQPPAEVWEESPFTVAFNLANRGAWDIEKGIVVFNYLGQLVEVESYNMDGSSVFFDSGKTIQFDILGKSLSNPVGETKRLVFNTNSKTITKTDKQETSFTATVCYTYATKLVDDICIDPDIYQTFKGGKPCTVQDLKPGNQGAPIAITNVKVEMLPIGDQGIKPQLTISFENVGGGDVFDQDYVEDVCSPYSPGRRVFNRAEVEVQVGNDVYECSHDTISFDEKGKSEVICYLDGVIEPSNPFTTSLAVYVYYGYTSSASAVTMIKRKRI